MKHAPPIDPLHTVTPFGTYTSHFIKILNDKMKLGFSENKKVCPYTYPTFKNEFFLKNLIFYYLNFKLNIIFLILHASDLLAKIIHKIKVKNY